ncbi:DUF6099 family protein [Actinacidiphila epipremni]|jgi:hypothetical protein|uniref:Uncharacterized protein n=1 Tax=Actinacidiphila epipremni TaxID=2053013 RepID=A0ABX0ZU80_9ACTN|nr:DUF6099 family protein [Actinacidiphila epipremni]NJP45178.1 hypothetical protein [Actinacidiphila epipremni]
MDAARLVAECERVMREAPRPEDVIEEAWQAGELVEAVARLLDSAEEPRRRRAAPLLTAPGAGPPRAARLTSVRDPAGTLRALRVLLGELHQALVALARAEQHEGAYWSCVEALDAVDEAREQVRALARGERVAGGPGAGESSCGV